MIFDRGRIASILFRCIGFPCIIWMTLADSQSTVTVATVFSEGADVTKQETSAPISITTTEPDYLGWCPSNAPCNVLGGECIDCDLESKVNCTYGNNYTATCQPRLGIQCMGPQSFSRMYECRYCYQTMPSQQRCTPSSSCRVVSAPREYYTANCTVTDDVLCLGRRQFFKRQICDWTSGKRWSTALILSITLGGFGADRFYLGLWKEGLGKLFSLGGLGVWTLVDVVLVATGYVAPADGSLYIF